jgi:chromatin remodeling complex protein RSC6
MPAKKATKKKATKKKVAKKVTKKKVAKKVTKKKATKKKVVKKATKKKVAKKATKKKVVKKATKKKVVKKVKVKTKRKPNAAFMKPMTPSGDLAAVIGAKPMPRTEVTKKLWAYIKKNNLQDKVNRRNINADDKLKKIFGKNQVSMFEMTKLVSKHLR